jgi:cytochrome c oxidase cbb3-type subunit 4
MSYDDVSRFAQQGGSLYFFAIFVIGAAYAFWPRKRDEFARAARQPLDDESPTPEGPTPESSKP